MLNKVEICGVNTSSLKVLPNDETIRLLRKLKDGDEEAREKLVEGNLRLVLSVIQRFTNRGEMVDDLFQVGCIGLIKAINNFDLNQDVRFSTYAVPMIIGELRRHLRDSSTLRVSRSLRDTAYKAMQAKEKYVNDHQKEPTPDELAKILDITREEIVMALDSIAEPVSLYEPLYSDSGDETCVMDQVRDVGNTDENWLEKIALRDAVSKLSEREKHILSLRFYEGRTQTEVAEDIGISQAQISRLEKTALERIRKQL